MGVKVEARGVSKRFGALRALDGLSFEIGAGECFGIIGPNGAGKTSFIRILTGFWLASEGDVFVDGVSVTTDRFAVQARLGYASEQPRLYGDHRVDSFLAFMGALRGLGGARLRAAVEAAIARFRLEPVAARRIAQLSKGFRQRVGLAQALLHDPALLVIDEPTVGLDPEQQLDLREILAGLRERHTVVLSTHQLGEAEALCDRVALLRAGRLVRIVLQAELAAGGSLEALFLASLGRAAELAP